MPADLRVLKGREHKKKTIPVKVPDADYAEIYKRLDKSGLPEAVMNQAKETLEILEEKKILGRCDVLAFERYCQHLRLAYEADALLRLNGVLTYDENGVLHKHPATQVHRDNSIAALRYEEQFGLTPSARMRLSKTEDQAKEDDYSEFRSARKTG
jgi:P27 family predicted phage terminase small subunit